MSTCRVGPPSTWPPRPFDRFTPPQRFAPPSDSGGFLPVAPGASGADHVAQAVRTGTSSSNDDWLDQFDTETYFGQGSTGPLVRDLQLRLHRLGFLSWTEANEGYGSYNAATAAAVRRLQQENRIQTNGSVGPNTANVIQEMINRLRNPALGR